MRHRSRAFRALIAAPFVLAAAAPPTHITVNVTNLRSAKGQILACLTARAETFPDCDKDPDARKLTVPVSANTVLDFGNVPNGRYAISLVHDENGNGRLDKRMMIPREGFGFSRDAKVMMGPPSFSSAAFAISGASQTLTIRMRYLF